MRRKLGATLQEGAWRWWLFLRLQCHHACTLLPATQQDRCGTSAHPLWPQVRRRWRELHGGDGLTVPRVPGTGATHGRF